jgi:hypothetical protein
MKLFEIIDSSDEPYDPLEDFWDDLDPDDSTQRLSDLRTAAQKIRRKPNHKMIGSGSYAYVGTDDDDNFGDVKRISRTTDGTAIYLSAIANTPAIQSNPYFPKVRNITKRKLQTSIIERLVPLYTSAFFENEPMMRKVHDQIFTDPIDPKLWPDFPRSFDMVIADVLQSCLYDEGWDLIRDPKLIEALQFINKIAGTMKDAYVDMSVNNMMWRPTQFGPQLVITDPLCE